MSQTHQMESDTAVEEREIIIQRAGMALSEGDQEKIRVVRDQLREYREMYEGDDAMAFVEENLRILDAALGETSPDAYAFVETDSK